MDPANQTHPRSDGIEDPHVLIGLRLWASNTSYALRPTTPTPLLVGSSPACAIRLTAQDVAPEHAHLTFDGERWWVRNLVELHRVRHDGVPSAGFAITAGVELGIGDSTLVAESHHTRRIRSFCQRLMGWHSLRMRAVDHALRAMRLAQAHRSPLLLCGEGDLVPIAHALHQLTVGVESPFIVCDRRRHDTMASVRAPANVPRGVEAYHRATGGTLCLRHSRLPADIDDVNRRAYEPDSEVQVILCALAKHRVAPGGGARVVELPPLQLRETELPRIVQEYAEDAIATLKAAPGCFDDEDSTWVMKHGAASLPEIEKATLRAVALRKTNSVAQAADLLGMASVSLTRWLGRRPRDGADVEQSTTPTKRVAHCEDR